MFAIIKGETNVQRTKKTEEEQAILGGCIIALMGLRQSYPGMKNYR